MLLFSLKGVAQAIVFLVEKLIFNLEIVKGLNDEICLFLFPTVYRGLDNLSHLSLVTKIY
jgi:hypothetical protein